MRTGLIIGLALMSAGCSWFRDPPPQPERRVTPGSRVIYNSGTGDTVWAICDRGDRIIMTERSPQITVIAGGCPSGQP